MTGLLSPKRLSKLYPKLHRRDGNECFLCGHAINMDLRSGPASASVDHVITRKDGGSGLQSNLKLAHKRCNMKRGATPIDEWFFKQLMRTD